MTDLSAMVKNVRKDIIRLAYGAGRKGAHLGPSLSMVEMLSVLFAEHFDFENDKFILSKGHGGLGYYAVMYAAGQISKEQLDAFEKNGSDFPGQPSRQPQNGVLYSSGSLGLGLSYGVGHAWSMRFRAQKGKVVVVMGDGELNEGSVWESVMLAKQQQLSNLLVIVDWNGMQSDGLSKDILYMDLEKIWKSFGWSVTICDGHDIDHLQEAYRKEDGKNPRVVLAKTVKGKGVSFMEGNKKWHHGHLDEGQYQTAMKELEGSNGV